MRLKCVVAIPLLIAVSDIRAANFLPGPPKGNWAKVQSLSKGESLTLILKQGDSIDGEFVGLNEQSVLLKVRSQERTYPRSAVFEVRQLRKGSRAKNAAIAGGIVFPIGFAIGYATGPYIADVNEMETGKRIGVGALVGALWGGIAAGITAAVKPGTHETVIYRAR